MVEQTGRVTRALATIQVATRPRRSRHLRRQDRVLRSKHQDLRDKLNFRAIYSHLNEFRLLPYCDHSILLDGTLTEQARIDTIIDNLTKCNKDNYLLDFIVCLKRSAEGTGDGHLELVQSLEAAYETEPEDEEDSDCKYSYI
jgi:hypothetical protein